MWRSPSSTRDAAMRTYAEMEALWKLPEEELVSIELLEERTVLLNRGGAQSIADLGITVKPQS